MIVSKNCIDFDTKTFRFGHFSGPSYRGAHAGWPAGWLAGWLASEVAPPLRKERQRKALTRGEREDCTTKQRNQKEDERTRKHMEEKTCQVNEKRKSDEKTSNSVIRSKNRRNDYSGSQFLQFSYFWLIWNAFHDKTISTIIEKSINTKPAPKTRKSSQNTRRGSPRDPRALLKAAKGAP